LTLPGDRMRSGCSLNSALNVSSTESAIFMAVSMSTAFSSLEGYDTRRL
jgi:hypothetical protein